MKIIGFWGWYTPSKWNIIGWYHILLWVHIWWFMVFTIMKLGLPYYWVILLGNVFMFLGRSFSSVLAWNLVSWWVPIVGNPAVVVQNARDLATCSMSCIPNQRNNMCSDTKNMLIWMSEGLLPQEKCRTGHGITVRFWCEPSLHQFIVAPWARRRKRVTASARANG